MPACNVDVSVFIGLRAELVELDNELRAIAVRGTFDADEHARVAALLREWRDAPSLVRAGIKSWVGARRSGARPLFDALDNILAAMPPRF